MKEPLVWQDEVTHGVRKVTHGVRKVTHGVRKITHGVRKVSHGVRKVSHGVRNRAPTEPGKRILQRGRIYRMVLCLHTAT